VYVNLRIDDQSAAREGHGNLLASLRRQRQTGATGSSEKSAA
jgi:hypothetical protein